MNKWEYSFVEVRDSEHNRHIEILNVAGRDGWEPAGSTVDTGYGTRYLMKRLLND